jgi:2-oxo-3-(phosphooxy)propyl 3-oxoalkanoate synthase
VDHVPGMLLLEAARQAGLVVCAPRRVILAALHSSFQKKYVEPDQPCWIETGQTTITGSPGDLRMMMIARQRGEAVFTAGLTVRTL